MLIFSGDFSLEISSELQFRGQPGIHHPMREPDTEIMAVQKVV